MVQEDISISQDSPSKSIRIRSTIYKLFTLKSKFFGGKSVEFLREKNLRNHCAQRQHPFREDEKWWTKIDKHFFGLGAGKREFFGNLRSFG